MEKNKSEVSIVIPAYNEEQNLGLLLDDLQKQEISKDFYIKEIIVTSDGSTDNTVKIATEKSFAKNLKIPIHVIDNKKREGKAIRLNEIFQSIKSDILVLFDADIRVFDSLSTDKLIKPIIEKTASLTYGDCIPLKNKDRAGIVEQSIYKTYEIWRSIAKEVLLKRQILELCNGKILSLKYDLYKQITIPGDIGTDIFIYLYSLYSGNKIVFSESSYVVFRLVSNVKDHIKQQERYLSRDKNKYFSNIYKEHSLTSLEKIFGYSKNVFMEPEILICLTFQAWALVKSFFIKPISVWNISFSTKKQIYDQI